MNRSETPLYSVAPFFLIRAPLLTGDHFFNLVKEDASMSLLTEEEQSLLREALAVASTSFYNSLLKDQPKAEKQKEQIKSTLLKYLLRMCSRSTPFGLFSFVSTGTWGNNSSIKFDLSQVQKRARPDMEWLFNLVEAISTHPATFPHVPIRRNPLIFNSGGRTHLHYLRENEHNDERKHSSIRSTQLTETIFELAKKTTTPIELRDEVLSQLFYLQLNPDKVFKMIQHLLDQQFLQKTILPSLLSPSFFSFAFDNISSLLKMGAKSSSEGCDESASISSFDAIEQIRSLIESYNKVIPGKGESSFIHLQEKMDKFAQSKTSLQVDAFYKGTELRLSRKIANELESTAEFLWKLSCCTSRFSEMRSYYEKFLDKYGTTRKVPLMELMNKSSGLGPPEHYLDPNHSLSPKTLSPSEKEWKKWLKRELALCLRKGAQEIEIPSELIDSIIKKAKREKAVPSFDLNCEIIAESSSHLDSGDFLLHVHFAIPQGGSTFGRFLDILGDDTQNKLRLFFKEEERLDPHSYFVNTCYSPARSRLANVKLSPNLRGHTLDLVHEKEIALEDIVVGASHERLYLNLKNQSKELVVVTNHMLSRAGAPHAIRFIEDVSESKYATIQGFSWFEMEDNCFLPRVRFQKTILSPATWKIDLFQLSLPENASYEAIRETFAEWGDLWHLPRYIYLTELDNRLLLDRNCSSHLDQIIQRLKKGDSVRLTETLGKEKKQWVQSEKGTHFSELTVPFIKNKQFASLVQDIQITPDIDISPNMRWKLPGSEWMYAKLYLNLSDENNLLSKECLEFSQEALDLGLISGWFFIRYNDPKSHLRLRFQIKERECLDRFITLFHKWSSKLLHHHFIYDVNLASYEREIERYGGEELIEYAEAVFCSDTLSTLDIIRHPPIENESDPGEITAALSMIDLLRQLGMNLQDQFSFFGLTEINKDELHGFRGAKGTLLKYSKAIFNDTLHQYEEMRFFSEAALRRSESLKIFAARMNELKAKNSLASYPDSILRSLIHMHCNRLIGREHKSEQKAYAYAFHTLKILLSSEASAFTK